MGRKRKSPEFAPSENSSLIALAHLMRPFGCLLLPLPFVFFSAESILATYISFAFHDEDPMLKLMFGHLLAINSVMAGIFLFNDILTEAYISMLPLPHPKLWLHATGFLLIGAGVGLVFSATQVFSAWILLLLFIVMFPANLTCVVCERPKKLVYRGSTVAALISLPLQITFVLWASWFTSPPLSVF